MEIKQTRGENSYKTRSDIYQRVLLITMYVGSLLHHCLLHAGIEFCRLQIENIFFKKSQKIGFDISCEAALGHSSLLAGKNVGKTDFLVTNHNYPKYVDTPYHTCPKFWTAPFWYLLMLFENKKSKPHQIALTLTHKLPIITIVVCFVICFWF